jgi:hypothetical protein
MIKKIRYGSLVYDTLYDTLIGDALRTLKKWVNFDVFYWYIK